MNIRPTITTYLTSIEDPAVTLTAAALDADSTVTSEIPEVDVREIDTVMKLYDGQTMIMGGLIEQSDAITENGVPFLKDIPLLGFLFKSYEKELKVTETVILLKATIITPDTQIDENDRKFYETFTTDPRPFIF